MDEVAASSWMQRGGFVSDRRRGASQSCSIPGWVAQLFRRPKFRPASLPTPPACSSPRESHGPGRTFSIGVGLAQKGDRRAKPQCSPVRPLCRLEFGPQQTAGYLETHPTAWCDWRAATKAGRAQWCVGCRFPGGLGVALEGIAVSPADHLFWVNQRPNLCEQPRSTPLLK
jgi:hypothetical protein